MSASVARSHGALLLLLVLLQTLLTAAESLTMCQTDPHLLPMLESRLPRLSLLAMSIGLVDSICSGAGETQLCKDAYFKVLRRDRELERRLGGFVCCLDQQVCTGVCMPCSLPEST